MEDKRSLIDRITEQLKKLDVELDRLRKKADQTTADFKEDYKVQIEELREKKTQMVNRLDKIKGSSDDAWTELRTGMEKSWSELKIGVDKAISKFKEKHEDEQHD
jgi:uncharacterized coiled-coil DUF342 family protein